ncbi:hypothetical protein CP8484711_1275B, partial [Chlamydia psittaci 84-8471/1]
MGIASRFFNTHFYIFHLDRKVRIFRR